MFSATAIIRRKQEPPPAPRAAAPRQLPDHSKVLWDHKATCSLQVTATALQPNPPPLLTGFRASLASQPRPPGALPQLGAREAPRWTAAAPSQSEAPRHARHSGETPPLTRPTEGLAHGVCGVRSVAQLLAAASVAAAAGGEAEGEGGSQRERRERRGSEPAPRKPACATRSPRQSREIASLEEGPRARGGSVSAHAEAGARVAAAREAAAREAAAAARAAVEGRRRARSSQLARAAADPNQITINLKDAKHAAEIVREVATERLGWRETSNLSEDCAANVFWFERAITVSDVKLLNECQRANMIPGMHDIAKKVSLAKALNRMRLLFPNDYSFYPRTWTLPAQLDAFRQHCASKGGRVSTYIVKPSGGCQGNGIYLVRYPEQLGTSQNAVVQEYVDPPALLDGYKFDLRLYVLVVAVKPMTVYLYKEGMARFATNRYARPTEANLHDVCMHLTNYALNKHNDAYVPARGYRDCGEGEEGEDLDEIEEEEEERRGPPQGAPWGAMAKEADKESVGAAESEGEVEGDEREARDGGRERHSESEGEENGGGPSEPKASKRRVSEVLEDLVRRGDATPAQVDGMWREIKAVIAKTMIAVGPSVTTTYFNCFADDAAALAGQRRCFHVLGIDLLLDASLKPWLLELNHNPSFTCDTDFDRELKGAVVQNTLELLDPQPFDKTAYADQLKSHIAARALKKATTPLEREKLEQQMKRDTIATERQKAKGGAAAVAAAAAAASAAATTTTSAAIAETMAELDAMPRKRGRYELALSASGMGYDRLMLFSSTALQGAWRHCCGVRGRKLTGTRFQRFVRDCGLMDSRLTQGEVHLLFQSVLLRHNASLDDTSTMNYHEFCDALLEIARRRYKTDDLASAMQNLLSSLPSLGEESA
ncbi:hypothetical protein AB1Y20_004602 [Prymnesium parvum]|uniref:Tubulin--tyrosine ligase-like protein 9 n=1 Tax=Prymnesium parvum TaxID=97485 RepID=A0AB34IWX2_PRYPA